MRERPSTNCTYNTHFRRRRGSLMDPCQPDWRSSLPREWIKAVIPPIRFRIFRESEIPARRILGYNRSGEICFSAHDYRLIDLRSDDDEDFYPALAYAESSMAWRLRDGRWLVYRSTAPFGDEGSHDTGFSLEPEMPR